MTLWAPKRNATVFESNFALNSLPASPQRNQSVAFSANTSSSPSTQRKFLDKSGFQLGFIKQVRAHQLLRKARLSRPKRVADFVKEESVNFKSDNNMFLSGMFKVNRPLKPERETHVLGATGTIVKHNTPHSIASATSRFDDDGGCNMVVQVMRAFNIPVRSAETADKATTPATPAKNAAADEKLVREKTTGRWCLRLMQKKLIWFISCPSRLPPFRGRLFEVMWRLRFSVNELELQLQTGPTQHGMNLLH